MKSEIWPPKSLICSNIFFETLQPEYLWNLSADFISIKSLAAKYYHQSENFDSQASFFEKIL